MDNYDLIIIGGGPGGYNAALAAAKAGLKTALIEKDKIGGTCLNEGCIPTKTLLYSAKLFDGVKNGDKYGVTAEGLRLDTGKIVDRKNKVVKTLAAGINSALKAAGVSFIKAEAAIERDTEGFYTASGCRAKNAIIATGSSTAIPTISGLDAALESGFAITSREALDMRDIPETLVVAGGGAVGLEMASYFCSSGSNVSVVKRSGKIDGSPDSEIAAIMQKNYEKKGVSFRLNSKIIEVKQGLIVLEQNGEVLEIPADKLLVCVGRVPNSQGLELLGVELDGRAVKTDLSMRTNLPGLYAIGDVNGKSMLAHTAYREGEVAVNNILGINDTVDYNNIPSIVYTNPESASVGEWLESAAAKSIDAECVSISMRHSGRYLAENEGGDGICKIIIERGTRRILGAHVLANYSSEFIFGISVLIQNKATIDDIKKLVFPHPTVAEIFREAAWE